MTRSGLGLTVRPRMSLLAAACAAGVIWAPAARADVTLGSSLGATTMPGSCGTPATIIQSALPGATLTSPFDGTIVSWGITAANGGPFHLQVIHPVGGGLFASTGSTASPMISGPSGVLSFPANLPIKAGDYVGIYCNTSSDKLGFATTPGAVYTHWLPPPLVDGGPARAPDTTAAFEEGFNAKVRPSNVFTYSVLGLKLNLVVPDPGTVDVAAVGSTKGAVAATKRKKSKLLLKPSSASGGPGTITVSLKLTRKAKQKLKKKGKVKLGAKITFTPTGGLANTQTAALTLNGKKKK